MMPKFYAGIGSRKTPEDKLGEMREMGGFLLKQGYTLRSGGALGADKAFEEGVDKEYKRNPELRKEVLEKEIFTARDWIPQWAYEEAERFHPAWYRLTAYAKKLHARNSMILYGLDGKTPVDFIVCWTPEGKISGGTGQALRIASVRRIKIFNMFDLNLEEIKCQIQRLV